MTFTAESIGVPRKVYRMALEDADEGLIESSVSAITQRAKEYAADEDAGLRLRNDECFCDTPTIASNEHDETWCSVCGERLLMEENR